MKELIQGALLTSIAKRTGGIPEEAQRELIKAGIPEAVVKAAHAVGVKEKGPLGKPEEVPPQNCPHCGKHLDVVTGIGHNSSPKPGSLTMCVGCGGFCQFDDDLKLKPFSYEQVVDLPPKERAILLRSHEAWTKAMAKVKKEEKT